MLESRLHRRETNGSAEPLEGGGGLALALLQGGAGQRAACGCIMLKFVRDSVPQGRSYAARHDVFRCGRRSIDGGSAVVRLEGGKEGIASGRGERRVKSERSALRGR